jgi:SAM-dependent methyltransferase
MERFLLIRGLGEQMGNGPSTQLSAYERMGAYYDAFSAHHDHDLWLSHLLPAVERFGLRGHRLLDVGCGTGKSFEPLLDIDWRITACDLSPAMLRSARRRANGQVRLHVADMCQLPVFGEFDLIWSLGDVINHLLEPRQLEACFVGMRRNLAPSGLLLFDTNTLRSHRTFYAETSVTRDNGHQLIWRGETPADMAPGGRARAVFEVRDRGGVRECETVIRQRHYPADEVEATLEAAGLQPLACFGHGFDAVLQQPLDETRHTKAIFIAKRQQPSQRR